MIDHAPHLVRIRLTGEFDLASKDRLTALLLPAQNADMAIIDLSEAIYFDASALGCLIALKNKMLARGAGVVHLIGARPNVRKVFKLTGLDMHFEMSTYVPASAPASVPAPSQLFAI